MEVAEDKFWTAGVVFHSGTAPSFTQPFDFPLKHQSWGWEGFESLRKFWCWCLGRPSAFSCDPASLTHATGNSQSECSLQGSLATFTNMYFTFPWENYYRLKKKKRSMECILFHRLLKWGELGFKMILAFCHAELNSAAGWQAHPRETKDKCQF